MSRFARLRFLVVSVLLLLSAAHVVPDPAQAQSNGVVYYVDANAGNDAATGTAWGAESAFATLTRALDAVDDLFFSQPVEIRVAQGTYYPAPSSGIDQRTLSFEIPPNVTIVGGYATNGVARDPDLYPTVLSGDIDRDPANWFNDSYQVVKVHNANVTLDGIQITHGSGAGSFCEDPDAYACGAGLLNTTCSLRLNDVVFANNRAPRGYGGGMYNGPGAGVRSCFGTIQLNNVAFLGNSVGYGGGGLYTEYPMSLNNVLFAGNRATGVRVGGIRPSVFGGEGGGLYIAQGTSVQMRNTTVASNYAIQAGGVYNLSDATTIYNSILWGNGVENTQYRSFRNLFTANGTNPLVGSNIEESPGAANPLFYNQRPATEAPTVGGDYRLQRGSPLVDAGVNADAPAGTALNGNPRISSTAVDFGAYEVAPIFYVDDAATGSGDGLSWVNAYTNLQDALHHIRNTYYDDLEIRVAEGTYYPDEGPFLVDNDRGSSFVLVDRAEVYGGFPTGGGTMAERNPSDHPSILDGDIDQDGTFNGNAFHVVSDSGAGRGAVLDGFTVTGGNANGAPDSLSCSEQGVTGTRYIPCGGGIFLNRGSPTLVNLNVTQNAGAGVGINRGSPLMINFLVHNNEGAGIVDYSNTGGAPIIINSTIANHESGRGLFQNTESSDIGSGPVDSSFLTLHNSIIWDNRFDPRLANGTWSNNVIEGSSPDPHFVDAVNGDFRLLPGSDAINAGNAVFLPTEGASMDVAGNPRILDSTLDIGSVEYIPGELPTLVDLHLEQSANESTVGVDTPFSFVLTVTNNGPGVGTDIAVTNVLTEGVVLQNATATQGSYNAASGVWQVGRVNGGYTATLNLEVTSLITGTITNSAEISASDQEDPDSTPKNNIANEDDQASVTMNIVSAMSSTTLVDPETNTPLVEPDDGPSVPSLTMLKKEPSDLRVLSTLQCPDGRTLREALAEHNGQTFPFTSLGGDGYSVDIPASVIISGPIYALLTCSSVGEVVLAQDEAQDEIIRFRLVNVFLYEPMGTIINAETGEPVIGAEVMLYRVPNVEPDTAEEVGQCRTTDTRATPVNAAEPWSGEPDHTPGPDDEQVTVGSNSQLIDPAINPQITDEAGRYGWLLETSCWYISVEAQGYQPRVSPLFGTPSDISDLHLQLTPEPGSEPKPEPAPEPAPETNQTLYLPLIQLSLSAR